MYIAREITRTDIAIVNQWRGDRIAQASLGSPYRFINDDVDLKWFENYLENRSNTVRIAVASDSSPETILGLVTIGDIDWIGRKAILHLLVGDPKNQGKGVGTFALTSALQHAFDDIGLNRLELSVLASNIRAQKLYSRFGFCKEGYRREAYFKDGRFVDGILMSMLRREWDSAKDEHANLDNNSSTPDSKVI